MHDDSRTWMRTYLPDPPVCGDSGYLDFSMSPIDKGAKRRHVIGIVARVLADKVPAIRSSRRRSTMWLKLSYS